MNEPGALSTFVDEPMQADWVLSLTESLARQPVVSGGAVIGWIDEYWKGRVIDSDETDARSSAMARLGSGLGLGPGLGLGLIRVRVRV